jgi:putative component of membrane protein insertase Oxa1/YidC/SpoIIIJ protein YidD
MNHVVISLINFYYLLIPEDKRRICIHSKSCSKYVLRIARDRGFIKAVQAYIERIKSCNSNYSIESFGEMKIKIKTKNGIILEEEQINPFLVKCFKSINS